MMSKLSHLRYSETQSTTSNTASKVQDFGGVVSIASYFLRASFSPVWAEGG